MAKHEISKTEVQLKLHELFSALTLEQQEMVFENLTIHSYRKNELIYCEGETPRELLCLLSGKVKIYMDGVGFCFLAQTLHPVEACYRINGLKKLVLAHFSIAQKFIPNAME